MILTIHLTSVRQVHRNTKRRKKPNQNNKNPWRRVLAEEGKALSEIPVSSDIRYFLTKNEGRKETKPDLNIWTKAITYDFFPEPLGISACALLSQRIIFKIVIKALNISCV